VSGNDELPGARCQENEGQARSKTFLPAFWRVTSDFRSLTPDTFLKSVKR